MTPPVCGKVQRFCGAQTTDTSHAV